MAYGISRRGLLAGLAAGSVGVASPHAQETSSDPLPSWQPGIARDSLIDFVTRVTQEGGRGYVPPADRIAVFDNDGTLWVEQPMYFQGAFTIDRIKALASQHPDWKVRQPFKSVLDGNIRSLESFGEKALLQIVEAVHSNITTTEFSGIVTDWIATARHPRFDRRYTDLVYLPMLELLAYLRANQFKTFIVSGGGVEFMRPWTQSVYGIPPEQVVGSSGETRFEIDSDGEVVLLKLPKVEFVDDGAGKPAGINRFIGRRPIFAFGNSDGDLQMLEWTVGKKGSTFAGLIHHTDAQREYKYDRESKIGRLDKALDAADARDWLVVDMMRDWRTIFHDVV